MSFDLIKKQKANIQKEKKKITASDYFRHPLAYQPKPKGREDATIEQIGKNTKKSTFDAFSSANTHRNNPNNEDFKITPDKEAANLFFSNFKPSMPGKRGGHISDVFTPKKNHLLKKPNRSNNQINSFNPPAESYPGYKEKATLMIKNNTAPEFYNGGEEVELKDRLGDLEMDLPRYEESEIYNPKYTPQYPVVPDTSIKIPVNKTEKTSNIEKLAERKPRVKQTAGGTTVKYSFKPEIDEVDFGMAPQPILETVPIPATGSFFEEEEEEEDIVKSYASSLDQIQNPPAPSKISHFTPPSHVQQIPIQRVKSEVHIPINKPMPITEEEEEPVGVNRDYHHPANEFTSALKIRKSIKKSQEAAKKLKKIWKSYQERRKLPKERIKITKMEFHSGKPLNPPEINPSLNEYIPAESSIKPQIKLSKLDKPKRSWAQKFLTQKEEKAFRNSLDFTKKNFFVFHSENAKRSAVILGIGVVVALTIPIGAYVQKVIEAKSQIEAKSNDAINEVKSAKSAMLSARPEEAQKNFETAYGDFLEASDSLDQVGGGMLSIIKVLPGGSKIASGQNILEAGKHLTAAGQIISEAFGLFLGDQGALKKKLISTDNLSNLKEATSFVPQEREDKAQTLTEAIIMFQDKLQKVKEELAAANDLLDKVDLKDVPQDKRDSFKQLKDQLPGAINGIEAFSEYSNTLLALLGHNQSKQYLFLFENNDELRATGGFIGTYGIMKINDGSINQLSIDGIYNPDGQLKERVIPPKPIQKMSATWSMHDANWWPDFPKSAEKVAWFYEKTGGPTVDGVIAFTPKIMEDLLKITGPINHEKYGVTVSADNFIELTQYKVEKDYDKKLNRPKQFLADLAPLLLEKIFNAPPEKWVEVMTVFSQDLEGRDIQMYFFDQNIQKQVSDLGWSGEVLNTPKDYLSVINTNISGLKTDKMIDQTIDHQAEIKPDGSIVDTVTITRKHNGGKEKYDWYNAVNSDWMRVYVPKGSELLHAEGYTREVDSPPVDYEKLGFVQDEMVANEENSTNSDPYTGTQVYEDSDKTVFANWTYVSPGESLTVKYSYLLPFKLRFDDLKKPADTYSLLAQKQAGDESSTLHSEVTGLDNYDSIYHYPDNLDLPNWKFDQKFQKDFFAGAVLVPKGTKIQ